ncbi:MAG: hypothetical protein WCL06_05850 [Bacteroidota bacterium]
MRKPAMPTSIKGFYVYLLSAYPWLISNATRLGVTTDNVNKIKGLVGDVDTTGTYMFIKKNYDETPGRKETQLTHNLKDITDKVKVKLREIYDDIPASSWTEDDRTYLNRRTGLPHKPSKPTVPIAADVIVDIIPHPNGLFEFNLRSRTDAKRFSLAEGADGAEVRYAIVQSNIRKAADMPDRVKEKCNGPDECSLKQVFFKAKFQFQLESIFAGYNLYCWVRWINSKYPQFAGKWSRMEVVLIS